MQQTLTWIENHLSLLGPAAPFLVAVIAWLLLPQQVVGGLRWLIAALKKRQARGDKRRAAKRGRFASAIMAAQVARISELEEWRDERFAEMDAEVEMHGHATRGVLRRRRRDTIRRVSSLSVALEESTDQIVLLEGEPGSGKSVALRHVVPRYHRVP
jgi:transcriptional regulator with GAF, ATPase, and Fis domain